MCNFNTHITFASVNAYFDQKKSTSLHLSSGSYCDIRWDLQISWSFLKTIYICIKIRNYSSFFMVLPTSTSSIYSSYSQIACNHGADVGYWLALSAWSADFADIGPMTISALVFPALSTMTSNRHHFGNCIQGLAVFVSVFFCIRGYASHQALSIV